MKESRPPGFSSRTPEFVEIDIEVRHAVEDFVVGLQPRLEGREQFLPDVGRVADDDIEAALGEDFGEGGLPVEGFGMDRRVADDAVALADGVVEAGQCLPRAAVLIQRLSWQIWMASALRSTP